MKIDKKSLTIVVDEELEGSLEEIAEGMTVHGSVVVMLDLIASFRITGERTEIRDPLAPTCTSPSPELFPVLTLIQQKHKDGRLSVPLVLINWYAVPHPPPMSQLTPSPPQRAPSSSPTELMMLHTSGLAVFQQAAECARVIEMREGAEDFTEAYINERLA